MAKVIVETGNYKHVVLCESKTARIKYVKDKKDSAYDRIYFTKYGDETRETEFVVVFRWEDEQFLNSILEGFNYHEG